MFLSNHSVSNSLIASILLKAKRFGIFSIFALTAMLASHPFSAEAQISAQITVDGSTATEVKGNVISPTGAGTVNGGNLYNSFDRFNVPSSGVIFNTGSSSVDGTKVNNIINRVTGDTPSSILGTIESRQAFPNANLYLLNPNGVIFGVNARLDIGGSFYATTGTGLGFDQNQKFNVDKSSLSFPSGDPTSIQFAIAQPAAIINQGNLTVDSGKNISLTAGTVINTGNLSAPDGNINLAAVSGNSQVELRSPDLVLGFAVTKDVIPTTWNGAIATLPKLAELLTGKASQANQVVVKSDGSIALVDSPSNTDIAITNGMAIASGKIDVSSATSQGGKVGIFGDRVGLVNSQINASGATGGGVVLVGGDLQGKGIVPNALQTYVDRNSQITANGLLVGDGGKVIIWADRSTQFYGAIAAQGGKILGNGGFVEVSGKQNLDYQGLTNTLANNGKTGTLLLDPTNISVVNTGGTATLANVSAFANSPANAVLNSSLINNATSNVVLQATSNITFSDVINITTSGVSLTAQAGNNITANTLITTTGGSVRLVANDPTSGAATGSGSITTFGAITTNGGAIDLQINNGGALSLNGNLVSGGGNITLQATNATSASGIVSGGTINSGSGAILINGASTTSSGITFSGINSQIISSTGTITLNGSSVNTTGLNIPSGTTISSTSGTINLIGSSTAGDGVRVESIGNATRIQTSGNINITGNSNSLTSLGINIQPPAPGGTVTIDSGAGNLTFTSDRSAFPSVALDVTGTLTLQPFSNGNLVFGGTNVFLSDSFLTTLALSSPNRVVIGSATSTNAISLGSSLSINTANLVPISILTAGTFNGNGNGIDTSTADFSLSANQGITGLGKITAIGGDVAISSSLGSITFTSGIPLSTSSTDASAGNITITANGDLTLGDIDSSNSIGNAGSVSLRSQTGKISTGNITTSSAGNGGQVVLDASTSINTGRINTSGTVRAGAVTLDPSGDVVAISIDASSLTLGANVTLISTGGNLRVTGSILASINASCVGASICTTGGAGGNIFLQTGGLNPFVVGDGTLNGSNGILTTGLTTLSLGTSIPVLLNSSFIQGGILITPGGFLSTTIPTNDPLDPLIKPDILVIDDPLDTKLLAIRDIFKKDADRYLADNDLPKAFDAIERAYAAELEIFTGDTLNLTALTIDDTQDLLLDLARRSGDVTALIYPVLLDNRIEILVIPPKDKGKPFRRFTVEANQEIVEALVTDYRNNLRDVGSNDYLEQSQKLYDWIMRPIESQLAAMKINTLVFVMDGGLRVTPPAALHDGKQFLIERYAIANIPSIRVSRIEDRDRKTNRILAMGLTESVEGFSPLPSVDIEIRTISSDVLKGLAFLNQDFTVSNLQNQRQQGKYNILHLGTHAKFISDTSQDSFIQFWDSRLKLSQIPKLRFDSPAIDMLTLSACQTAVGNNLGISGLAVESGAKSVLASLWEVSDAGTAPLMISFYKAFPNAIHKAQAIQQAQINLLKGKVNIRNNQIVGIEGFPNIPLPDGSTNIDLSHPFYWSSFILVGNWL